MSSINSSEKKKNPNFYFIEDCLSPCKSWGHKVRNTQCVWTRKKSTKYFDRLCYKNWTRSIGNAFNQEKKLLFSFGSLPKIEILDLRQLGIGLSKWKKKIEKKVVSNFNSRHQAKISGKVGFRYTHPAHGREKSFFLQIALWNIWLMNECTYQPIYFISHNLLIFFWILTGSGELWIEPNIKFSSIALPHPQKRKSTWE